MNTRGGAILMSQRKLVEFLIKCLSLYIIFNYFGSLIGFTISVIGSISNQNNITLMLPGFVYPIIWMLTGILTFIFSEKLATLLLKSDSKTPAISTLDINLIAQAFIGIMGLYVLIDSLPLLADSLVKLKMIGSSNAVSNAMQLQNLNYLTLLPKPIAKIIIGFLLMYNSQSISMFLLKKRSTT